MTRVDRTLFISWICLSTVSGVAFACPGLMVLFMLTVIGIPIALVLGLAPGLWVYASAALPIYAGLRWRRPRRSPAALLGIAAILVLTIGILIPVFANKATDARVALYLAGDHGDSITLAEGASVTYLVDRGLGETDGKCADDCQRLLMSGVARNYVAAPLDALHRLNRLPARVFRYSLALPDGHCRNDRLSAAYMTGEEAGPNLRRPLLWDKLAPLGKCLHADLVRDGLSDYVMADNYALTRNVEFDFARRKGLLDLSLHPVGQVRRWQMFQRRGEQLVAILHRTQVEHARLTLPLWLLPPVAFDTWAAAHWSWTRPRKAGFEIERYSLTRWEPWITNDIGLHGLPDPQARSHFDKARPPS